MRVLRAAGHAAVALSCFALFLRAGADFFGDIDLDDEVSTGSDSDRVPPVHRSDIPADPVATAPGTDNNGHELMLV
jgi:hypothetical protein